MAAPVYSEDLTDISTAETTTGWSAYGGGASGLSASPDLAMQGTNCVDKQITNAEKGQLYDNGSGITMGADDHTFIWLFVATPGLSDTLVNRGVVVGIGSGTNAFCKYHVEGNDTYGAGGRVGKCYVVDQSVDTNNTGSVPYRTRVGTPSGTLQYFGGGLSTTASVKGANLGVDAIRYGTGAYITAGEVADAATFAGFATQNDSSSNRWGILTDIGGTFELQGRFVVGQNSSKTATACHFDDSDVNIVFIDTPHAAADFTQIIVDHASTVCNLTNVNLTALGTTNPGRFVVNSANPTVDIVGGTWTDIGITTLRSNTTVDGLTWRRTGQITLNGATVDNCLIDENAASAAVVTDDLADLTGNTFVSDGTGHAVELTALGSGTMTWNNDDSGYAASDGSTGNETIYVNVGSGSLTINVAAGASTPTVRTAGATVTVVSGQVTTTITVVDIDTASAIQNARVYLTADTGGPLSQGTVIINALTNASGVASDTRSLPSDQPVTGWVRKGSASTYYKEAAISATIDNGNGLSLTVQMIPDE